jgi:hypothetical protein
MLAHFGAEGRPPLEESVLRACVLAPGGVPDASEVVRQAKDGLEDERMFGRLPFVFALAHGRAGKWQEFLAQVPESVVPGATEGWQWWPVLALAHHHLGHAEEARRWLDRAAEKHGQFTRRTSAFLSDEEMDFSILYVEAASLLAARTP